LKSERGREERLVNPLRSNRTYSDFRVHVRRSPRLVYSFSIDIEFNTRNAKTGICGGIARF
jgi:hypothetical protein